MHGNGHVGSGHDGHDGDDVAGGPWREAGDARWSHRSAHAAADRVPRCRRCSARLSDVRGHMCPECGAGFDLEDPRTFRNDAVPRVLLLHGNAGGIRLAELTLMRRGIQAFVQEDFNAAGIATARLWVGQDDAEEAAGTLAAPPESGKPWMCACGEPHEGQFGECWSCGGVRPEEGAVAAAVGGRDGGNGSRGRGREARIAAVPDVEELVAWYQDVLGLVPSATTDDSAWFEYEGVTLHVRAWGPEESGGGGVADEPTIGEGTGLGTSGAGDPGSDDPRPVFVVRVPSAEDAIDRLAAAGAAFVDEVPVPVEGGRSALFIDCFGIVHEVFEPDGWATPRGS